MKQYYLVINGEKSGPFTIDQLATQQLTPETPVWTEGMSDWMPAQQVAELSSFFAPQTPGPEMAQPTVPPQAPAYNAAPSYGNPQPQTPNGQVASQLPRLEHPRDAPLLFAWWNRRHRLLNAGLLSLPTGRLRGC